MDIRQTASLEIGNALANITRLEQGYARMQATAGKPINIPITGIQGALGEVQKLAAGLTGLRGTNTIRISASLAPGTAASLSAALASLNVAAVPVKLDLSQLPAQLSTLRTQLSSIGAGLSNIVSVNTSGLLAVQTQITAQITSLTALIAQLRALGGGGPRPGPSGGGSGVGAANQQLLAELNALNNQYKRSDITAAQYGASLTGLQTRLRAAAAATVGTSEFRALDNGLTALNNGLKRIQTDAITKIRVELSGARAAFDAAAAAATTYGQRQAAIGTYGAAIASTRTQLQGLATSGALSAEQLKAVNGLLGQTARELNTINGRVNLAGLSGNIVNSLGTLSQFVPGLGQVVGLFSNLTGQAGAAAVALGVTTVAVGLLTAGFIASFRTAATFQQSLADIKALTQPTADEFVKLSDAAINIGAPLGVGGREAAGAIRELNKAGLSAADALGGGLTAALNLAGAAGVNAAEGSKLAVGAMTAFGLTAKDLPGVADTFANFANSTFLDAQDLSLALAAVGPVAKSAGLSLNEFAGLSATLAQGGFKNMSDAGTSLKAVLLALQAPSSTAADALKQLGTDAYDGQGNLKPLGNILESLRGRLKGLTEEGRNAALKDIFGTDGIRAATILLGQSQAAINGNIAAIGKQGEAQRVATERLESYQGSQKKFNQALERLEIIVGQKLLPLGTKLAEFFTGIAEGLGNAANNADTLKGYLVALGIVLVSFNGAAILTFFTTALPAALVTATLAVRTFLASNPVGLILTVAAGVGLAVKSIIDDTQAAYAAMDKNDAQAGEGLLKRVAALRKAGDEVGNTKAQILLAQQALSDAQTGTLTGTNLLGERQYSIDPAAVEKARARLQELQGTLKELQATQATNSQGMVLATIQADQYARATSNASRAVFISAADLKTQAATIKSVRQELAGRLVVGLDTTAFQQDVEKIASEFDKLRIRLKADVKDPVKLKVELAFLDSTRAGEERAALQKQFATDTADRVKHERDVQRAQLDLLQDARLKRQGVLQGELSDVRASYAEQIKATLSNAKTAPDSASRRQFQQDAGGLQQQQAQQELAIRRKADADLAQIDEDRVKKTQEAQQRVLDGQASGYAANIKFLEGQRDRELALAGESATGKLAIEQRYGPLLAQLRDQQAGAGQQAQRSALAATYRQQIEDARTAGGQRSALELAARQEYIQAVQTLDTTARAEANTATLTAEARVREQQLAIYQGMLDKRLAGLSRATGQEIASAERTLQADRLRAQAQGNAGQVSAIDKALASIGTLKSDNLTKFREELTKSSTSAADLRTQLDNIAQGPLQKALSSAANPFNSVLKGARDNIRTLNEAYGKLTPDQQASGQGAALRSQLAEQNRIVLAANQERNQALLTAQQVFDRARDDKAADAAAKLAKTQFDGRAVTESQYDRLLDADRAYWQKRLAVAVKGSEDEDKAQQHLADNQAERDRARQVTQTQQADARSLTREELDSQLALAKTEVERVRVRGQLIKNDADRLSQVDRELATLKASKGSTEEIAKLERERLTLRGNLNTAAEEGRQREADSRQFAREQLVGQLALAKSEQERARIRGQIFAGDQSQLATLRSRLAAEEALGAPVEKIRKLKDEILALETGINTQQQEQQQRTEALLASQLSLTAAEGARQAAMARSNAEVAGSKVGAVTQAGSDLSDVDRRIAGARDQGKSEADINALLTEREGKVTALYQAQRDAARYGLEVSQQQLDLDEARFRAQLQLTGMADDAVASAQLDLDVIQRQLAAIDDQLSKADEWKLTEAEINALQVKRLGLLGQEAEQSRKVLEAQRQRRNLGEAVALGGTALAREAGPQSSSATANALNSLTNTRARLALATRTYSEAQADLNREQTSGNLQKFQSAQDALTSSISNQRKAIESLAGAYRDQLSSMDSVRDATEKLRAVAPTSTRPVSVSTEFDRLFAIQKRRDEALRQVQAAIRQGDAKLIASTTGELTAQQDRYNKQAAVLGKAGVQVTRQGDAGVKDVLDQLDKLGLAYDQEAAVLSQRAATADQEAKAAVTFGDATDRLPSIFQVGAQQLQQAIQTGLNTLLTFPQQASTPAAYAPSSSTINQTRGGDTITYQIETNVYPAAGQDLSISDVESAVERGIDRRLDSARRDKAWKAGC